MADADLTGSSPTVAETPRLYVVGSNTGTNASTATTTQVWSGWNDGWEPGTGDYLESTSTNVEMNGLVTTTETWVTWNTQTVGTATAVSTNTIWLDWNDNYVPGSNVAPHRRLVHRQWEPPAPETAEQRAAREREEAVRRRQQADRRRLRTEAEERAEKLLLGFLTRQQRKDWVKSGQFYLFSGKKRYRIKRGRVGNVELVDQKGGVLERYCCHPRDMVPESDTALSQMLALLHNEKHFLDLANVHHRAQGFNRSEYERRLAA